MKKITQDRVLKAAADLLGPDPDIDPEYVRAIVELTNDICGFGQDDTESTERFLRVLAGGDPVITPEHSPERAELDKVINKWFPKRLGTFYEENNNDLAAVEDMDGNMWRVWADGDTQKYNA